MKFTSVRKFACVLSLTSIFSIGFASWTMTNPEVKPTSVSAGLQADYVIKADDYVSFKSVILPEYNAGGFVTTITKEGATFYTNSSTADMVLNLVVDYEKCQELIARDESTMDITVTFTLQSDAKEFFNDTLAWINGIGSSDTGSAKPWISANTAVVKGETVTIGYTVLLEGYDFTTLTADGAIKLTIAFNASGKESAVKGCLENNTFVFNTSVHSK